MANGRSHSLSSENLRKHSSGDAISKWEHWAVRSLLRLAGNPSLAIKLWNGEIVRVCPARPVARIVIHDRRSLLRLLSNPLFQFGEAYSDGRVEVQGDLVELLVALERSLRESGTGRLASQILSSAVYRPRRNTLAGSRDNIHHHYDIGNDFYKLWLDDDMVYTCAYFASPSMTLEEAQRAKYDHICRKLRLRPGETVVEAGCGWGTFALHMARHYGVKVKAFDASHEHIVYAHERLEQEGLRDHVEFFEDDWRNITGRFDAFVSVGMLEHVGLNNYPQLGDVIHRCLKGDGRGLLHSIGRNKPAPIDPWIERRIFPGAYPPSLREMIGVLEPHDFSVLDVENLRPHYAQTLRHWLHRFEESADVVSEMFDERFVRMWRLYLAGSIAAFQSGGLQLFQILFSPRNSHDVPWTRAHLYPNTGAAIQEPVAASRAGK